MCIVLGYDCFMNLSTVDMHLIHFFRRYYEPMARFAIFVIYFWFGFLKVFSLSPAEGMVTTLLNKTLPFISPDTFIIFFGAFEIIIGILFIIKGLERIVIPLLLIHLIATSLPLFIMTDSTWVSTLVPTMTGQYIIKNLLIIAAAMGIASNLHTIKNKTQNI